jgi:hypothetical protein
VATEVPWFPAGLHKQVSGPAQLREDWCYVVLEEIVDGVALLLRWAWPLADEKGRLSWREGDDREVLQAGIPVATLQQQLYRPSRVQRTPRVGDTFAVHRDADAAWDSSEQLTDVEALFPGQVIDVTADARAAAKLAYQGSLVAPVPKTKVDPELVREAARERGQLRARPMQVESRGAGR